MHSLSLSQSRFIVGLVLIAISALMFILDRGGTITAGAVAIGILGLVSLAISRRGHM